MKIKDKEYLKLAVPFILSTITQPLLGAVDTAVVGHLDDAKFIGGVSVGALIFSTIYWIFGFLRVGTTSLSARAFGAGDENESTTAFFRPLIFAVFIGTVFITLQVPIFKLFIYFISPGSEVSAYAKIYFDILIYGAPLVLMNYSILGWLMGRSLLKESLLMQISGNLLNIILDFTFVFYLKMDVKGVAVATLVSQIITSIIGIYFISRNNKFQKKQLKLSLLLDKKAISSMAKDNINFMIRTSCLLVQANIFTRTSASLGVNILAANAILLQIQYFISYMFDGLANASSFFAGKALGSLDRKLLDDTWKITCKFITILIGIITLFNILFLNEIVNQFTSLTKIKNIAMIYSIWIYIFPLFSGFGLAIYGVFTGTLSISSVRNSTVLALLLYLSVWKTVLPLFGNHGLWLSLVSFYFGRSLFFVPMKNNIYEKFKIEVEEEKFDLN